MPRLTPSLFARWSSSLLKTSRLTEGELAQELFLNAACNNNIVYLTNLKGETSKDQITKYFEKYGKVSLVTLYFDSKTGLHGGFGAVKFKNNEGVSRVLQKDQHLIDESLVNVEISMPSHDPRQKFETI
ncbi:RNA recognition motif domain-containing protein [Ditylenchus destructor]|nr:RNA recognition motif domain-containing protein [Ditylenchus destructor]